MTPLRLIFLILLFLILTIPLTVSAQPIKIASVDMGKVFDEYYKTKKAAATLNDRKTSYDKEIKERGLELEKMQDDLKKLKEESENPVFTDDKRAEKRGALGIKITEWNQQLRRFEEMKQIRMRDFLQQEEQMKKMLVGEITEIVNQKARKDGCTMVVDKSGLTSNRVPVFVYIQDSLDITADIIKTLNAGAPVETPSPKPASGDKPKEKNK